MSNLSGKNAALRIGDGPPIPVKSWEVTPAPPPRSPFAGDVLLTAFLVQIAAGQDGPDTLGPFSDWLEEHDLLERASVVRQWLGPEVLTGWVACRLFSPRVDQGALGAEVLAGHRDAVRCALAGQHPVHLRYPRAIRDARMDFRREVLSWFPGALPAGTPVSSRSDPPWVPERVERQVQDTLHHRTGLQRVRWKLVGFTAADGNPRVHPCVYAHSDHAGRPAGRWRPDPVVFRQVECRPLTLRYSVPTGLDLAGQPNGAVYLHQTWWIGQCEECRVVYWLTEESRALEDLLAEEERQPLSEQVTREVNEHLDALAAYLGRGAIAANDARHLIRGAEVQIPLPPTSP